MRILTAIICSICLSGCVDNYTPVLGGAGSAANLRADTRDCREKASDIYLYDQGHAAVALGVLAGGAIGGGIAAASLSSRDMTQPTLSQMIQLCMAKRGYVGTSSPY